MATISEIKKDSGFPFEVSIRLFGPVDDPGMGRGFIFDVRMSELKGQSDWFLRTASFHIKTDSPRLALEQGVPRIMQELNAND